MKQIKKILFITIVFLSFSYCVFAEEIIPPQEPINIHLTITTNNGSLYDNATMNVSACDSENPNIGNLKITAYCAILQSGLESNWNFSWAPGIFLNSINSISGFTTQDSNNNPVYHYWNWSSNGTDGMIGLNQYELQPNDTIVLNFIDPVEPEPEPEIIVPITHHHSSNNNNLVTTQEKKNFDLSKALSFLASQQKENGSFGEDIYTDWATLALTSSPDYQDQKIKLKKYLSENKLSGTLLTDYERRSMALMSIGINPYNINNENYIEKITSFFDGIQFGDKNTDNDDIFALIVLQNAGYGQDEKIITETINFIISKQKENGSWDENIDMTGASIQALSSFSTSFGEEKIAHVLEKAKGFLKEKQNENGGWNNVSSTSWAMQGILALGEKPQDWIKNENTPLNYLAINQNTDGSIKNLSEITGENIQSKIWETSYVITSMSEKTWNEIMQKFEKPIIETMPIIINPFLQSKIDNAHQVKLIKKIEKFQKPIEKIEKQPELASAQVIKTVPVQIEKKSLFRKIMKIIKIILRF